MDRDRRIRRLTLQYMQPRQCSEITLLSHEDLYLTGLHRCRGKKSTLYSKNSFLFIQRQFAQHAGSNVCASSATPWLSGTPAQYKYTVHCAPKSCISCSDLLSLSGDFVSSRMFPGLFCFFSFFFLYCT